MRRNRRPLILLGLIPKAMVVPFGAITIASERARCIGVLQDQSTRSATYCDGATAIRHFRALPNAL
jgi:hypothetical protein